MVFLGTVPVFVVVCLYLLILGKALKKVNEYKKAQNGVETENHLRYFRGGGASDQEDNSDTIMFHFFLFMPYMFTVIMTMMIALAKI